MIKIDVVTIFPRMLQAPLEDGIVHRAILAGYGTKVHYRGWSRRATVASWKSFLRTTCGISTPIAG